MRRLALICLTLAGCSDTANPSYSAPVLRISGPTVGRPGDTVAVTASANDLHGGTLPDSTLVWLIGVDTVGRGYSATIRLPASGSVVVTLAFQGGGYAAQASDTIRVAEGGSLLWRVTLPAGISSLARSEATGSLFGIGNQTLLSVTEDPSSRWAVSSSNFAPFAPPMIAPGGDVYVAGFPGVARIEGGGGRRLWTDSLNALAAAVGQDTAVYIALFPGGVARVSTTGATSQFVPASFNMFQNGLFFVDRLKNVWGFVAANIAIKSYATNGDLRVSRNGDCFSPTSMVPNPDGGVILSGGVCIASYGPAGLKWKITPVGYSVSAAPAVGSDGSIYLGLDNGAVVALNSNGVERWRSSAFAASCTSAPRSVATPAIGAGGMVYFQARGLLVAVGPDGSTRWSAFTVTDTATATCVNPAPVLLTTNGWVLTVTSGTLVSAFAAGTIADTTATWGQFMSDENHSNRGH